MITFCAPPIPGQVPRSQRCNPQNANGSQRPGSVACARSADARAVEKRATRAMGRAQTVRGRCENVWACESASCARRCERGSAQATVGRDRRQRELRDESCASGAGWWGRRRCGGLARGGAWADGCGRWRVRIPDVGLLVLIRVHQGEADEQGGGEDRGDKDDGVEEAVVAQVHEEEDHEGRLDDGDGHRDAQVDGSAEVDLGGKDGDDGEEQECATGRDEGLEGGDVREAVVAVVVVVVLWV